MGASMHASLVPTVVIISNPSRVVTVQLAVFDLWPVPLFMFDTSPSPPPSFASQCGGDGVGIVCLGGSRVSFEVGL